MLEVRQKHGLEVSYYKHKQGFDYRLGMMTAVFSSDVNVLAGL